MTRSSILTTSIAAAIMAAVGSLTVLAGPLNPPAGPVTSTGKTTQEIFDKAAAVEPRTAMSAANTPGEADSMFSINQSGSYYLTSDLLVSSGKSGIKINNGGATNVTIDLNGFTIHGGAGTLDGIRTTLAAGGTTLRIYNGAITGMSGNGTNVYAQNLDLTHIAAQFCGTDGISFSGDTITATDCRSFWNTGAGFRSSGTANITGCAAELNTGDGYNLSSGLITRCTTVTSSGRGIVASSSCQITDCYVSSTLDGIVVGFGSLVARNKVTTSSTRIAIHATGSSNRIEENEVQGGLVGIQVDTSSGNVVVKNFARSNTTPYNVPVANFFGTVITSGASVGSAGAWSNFAY